MDYVYVITRQQSAPESPKSGWIWIQTDANNNDETAWIYIGSKWVPIAGA